MLLFSPSPSEKRKETFETSSFFNKSTYLLFASILLIVGIIIFVIFWQKRQLHSSTDGKISKTKNIPPTYDTPESNDVDAIIMNEDGEASIVKDEE